MPERLIVVGAGMAGLNLALALNTSSQFRVVLLERDLPTTDGPPGTAFNAWRRRGVSHFRQSHIFHPRLLALYRRHHPDLLAELLGAGARELTVEEAVPARLRPHYSPAAADQSCTLLLSRRATFEAVLRRYVTRLPAVELLTSTNVSGVVSDGAADHPRIVGIRTEQGGAAATIHGDVIVDASGRFTRFPRWLRDHGVEAREQANVDVDTVYYTRYYRLRGGCAEPTEFGRPVFGGRDYLSCCVYPGDNGHFSVTLTCSTGDLQLRQALADPDRFQMACISLAEIAPWVALERAEPATGVLAMARFRNYWRSYVATDQPLVHGFFAIGDSLAHTNPAYGAGCSWAAQHAHILAEILTATTDPAARARRFDQRVRAEAYPFYSLMALKDQKAHGAPEARASGHQRLRHWMRAIQTEAVAAARAGDIGIFLWALQQKYMARPPRYWADRLFLLRRFLLFLVCGEWYRHGRPARRVLSRSQFLAMLSESAPRADRI